MLKRRKESDAYLATFHRYRWSAQMTMKKDNLLELSARTVAFIRSAVLLNYPTTIIKSSALWLFGFTAKQLCLFSFIS
jgi:hypothetical protein